MTIDEFLVALEAHPAKWEITELGRIRCGEHCPITYLSALTVDYIVPARYFRAAALLLGISSADATSIAHAADYDDGYGNSTELRKRLLKVLGLTND
jgi:hypothetical protein